MAIICLLFIIYIECHTKIINKHKDMYKQCATI